MKSLPLTAAVTTQMVAQFLHLQGFESLKVTDSTDVTDGVILFRDGIHVQVGVGYACVVIPLGDGTCRFMSNCYDARAIVPDLKKALGV